MGRLRDAAGVAVSVRPGGRCPRPRSNPPRGLPRAAGGDRPAAAVIVSASPGPARPDRPRRRDSQRTGLGRSRLTARRTRPASGEAAGPPPSDPWPPLTATARPRSGPSPHGAGRRAARARPRRSPPSRSSTSSTSPAARRSSSGDRSPPGRRANWRTGGQAGHRGHGLSPHGGALLKWRPISSPIAAATGAPPRPSRLTLTRSRRESRRSAPSASMRPCWTRWAVTSSAPTR